MRKVEVSWNLTRVVALRKGSVKGEKRQEGVWNHQGTPNYGENDGKRVTKDHQSEMVV